jgi:hypothetical protein
MRTIILLGSVVAVAACGGGGNANFADTTATTVAFVEAPATPFYEIVGHHAENAYDQVKAANWPAARAAVDSLNAAMRSSRAQDTLDHGTDLRAALARLDTAVTRRARGQGLRDANQLTQLGAAMAAPHNPPVPTSVTMLDYFGRELEIGAEARDAGQLSRAASGIREAWTGLRPQVVAHGGTAEAVRFDRVVADVAAARTPAQYGRTATPVLDQVDALEIVFTK